MKQDLKANPPQPFNIARALRVFSSKVQYIELQVTNYRFNSRQVTLPAELIDVADNELKKHISGRIRAPIDGIGKLKIPVKTADKVETIEVDGKWLTGERKRIEDTYTYVVPNFGRVILCTDRQAFDAEIEIFKENLKSYHTALSAEFDSVKTNLENMLVREYLPKWKKHPPGNFARYNLEPTENNLKQELRTIVKDMLAKAVSLEPPSVRVVYKNIAPESVKDNDFRKPLESIMLKRGLPHMKVKSLFASGDAAPGSEHLYNHALKA